MGSALYESLYRLGYGSDRPMIHYLPVLNTLRSVHNDDKIYSVLDVGCSHGGGVRQLWEVGIPASGVDISPTAAAMATQTYGDNQSMCAGPCFQNASVTNLPFADKSFDAILSTDVLEHLDEAEVQTAVIEMARVTRKWMFLKVSNRLESIRMHNTKAPFANSTYARAAMKQFGHKVPPHLHTAVHGMEWWVDAFNNTGFKLNTKYKIRVPVWACCAFVLEMTGAVF